MREPKLLQIGKVPVAGVDDSQRLRPVSEAGVESLIASVEELGVMKDPIHVRQVKSGVLVLIAGGHRLEMARRLGWEEIEAKVWTDVTDDWACLMEIDDNLAGAEMNALDTAIFLATRKRVYEKLHPETKAGLAGAAARWNASDIVSFASATAEKFGVSKRHIERLVAAGGCLGGDEIDLLRGSTRQVTLKDLTEIAKIGQDDERKQVVLRLSSGNAKSASDARKSLAKEAGTAPVKDPVEDEFQALLKRWKRASPAIRRRFVTEAYDDLSDLVSDECERRER
ncbi:ParB-like nuclease domain protein [Thalassovita gelatinovora]|uniref:ParB-like nuclease domain protein n=1 Tax=Thalassovita gelatinovora TaxID=53501 RepID=A0A0P1FJ90_THAGE|nr:ParB N-terminal domain-containing protein [Thalassovita gelatinovora]QIZ81589.1 ParB N-terminal domain-containing protein [Thalassovita gelatinovora]CUH68028.1 ParB-like nuclease domain protein [Thalassovita gelatinovora]SEQ27812.1 chromosome partitioning protein, ParB family [Thalassovita gelatinovora]